MDIVDAGVGSMSEEQEPERKEGNTASVRPDPEEITLVPGGEAAVVLRESPPRPPADKQIHPRRVLPSVPEGPDPKGRK